MTLRELSRNVTYVVNDKCGFSYQVTVNSEGYLADSLARARSLRADLHRTLFDCTFIKNMDKKI